MKFTSTNCPARTFIKKGVIMGATKVDIEAIVTDKGIFALAIKANTFEVTPLGTEPINITPAAISGGNPNPLANEKPTKGIIVK